jgi:hypothetical protein
MAQGLTEGNDTGRRASALLHRLRLPAAEILEHPTAELLARQEEQAGEEQQEGGGAAGHRINRGKGRLDESSRQVVVREEATGRTVAG